MPKKLIPVFLDAETWQALIDSVPMSKETYTADGIRLFGAVQAISQALQAAAKETP